MVAPYILRYIGQNLFFVDQGRLFKWFCRNLKLRMRADFFMVNLRFRCTISYSKLLYPSQFAKSYLLLFKKGLTRFLFLNVF